MGGGTGAKKKGGVRKKIDVPANERGDKNRKNKWENTTLAHNKLDDSKKKGGEGGWG